MVVFTCQKCNSTLKKNAVEKHNSCRPFYLTCIDCLKDFRGKEYDEHKSCITEMQKYGGSNIVVKPHGVKQEKWMELAAETLVKISSNHKYKNICIAIQSSPNIPRNKKKFHNFIKSAHPRLYKDEVVNEIFDHLIEAKEKYETSEEKQSNTVNSSNEANRVNEIESNADESFAQDKAIKKKKKKNKTKDLDGLKDVSNDGKLADVTNGETKLENGNISTENGDEEKLISTEQQVVLANGNNPDKSRLTRKKKKKFVSMAREIKLEDIFNIEKNEINQMNKENCDTVCENNEKVKSNDEEKMDVENGDLSKLTKKELKKLKKQERYKAEIAEIENYEPDKENPEVTEEEMPKKKQKKSQKKEPVISSISPKRKHEEDEVCDDQDLRDKRIKLNDTLVEEEVQSETRKKFKWGKAIKSILERSPENMMSLKKLRKKVLSEFAANAGEDISYEKLLGIFNKKVNSTVGVKVIKDRAQLTNI